MARPTLLRTSSTSLLFALLSFISPTAVIVGILAMHVLMGGHGVTTHHGVGPTTLSSTDVHPASTTVSSVVSAGHTHHDSPTQLLTPLTSVHIIEGVLAGCGGDCAAEMALSMCGLAIVLVGIAWLLTPTGRILTSSLPRRGPPVAHWVSRPVPSPSLTRLCISRT